MPSILKTVYRPRVPGLVPQNPLRFGQKDPDHQDTMDWLQDVRAAFAAEDKLFLQGNGGHWKVSTVPPDLKRFTGQIEFLNDTWKVERQVQYRNQVPVETKFMVESVTNPNRFFGLYSLSKSPYTVFYTARLDQNHPEWKIPMQPPPTVDSLQDKLYCRIEIILGDHLRKKLPPLPLGA